MTKIYRFCLPKIGGHIEKEYLVDDFKRLFSISDYSHELEFLDYFTSFFEDKSSLVRFLGRNPLKYSEIFIAYESTSTIRNSQGQRERKKVVRLLPVHCNSYRTRKMTSQLLSFQDRDLDTKCTLSSAYAGINSYSVSGITYSRCYDEVISHFLYNYPSEIAFRRATHMPEKAFEYLDDGNSFYYRKEMYKSYLNIRKAYDYLIENGKFVNVPNNDVIQTLFTVSKLNEQLYHHFSPNKVDEVISGLNLSNDEYEEIIRIRRASTREVFDSLREELMLKLTPDRNQELSRLLSLLNEEAISKFGKAYIVED